MDSQVEKLLASPVDWVRGSGSVYDVVPIVPDMPVSRLIFLLAKSLEVSNGQARVVAFELGRVCILVREEKGSS